jgi:hypothetical protein
MKNLRILEASESGHGILVEADAGWVSPRDSRNEKMLREAKEISFTVAGVTTKVSGKDDDAFRFIFDNLYQVNDKKLGMLRDKINDLLFSEEKLITKAES